MSDYLRRLLRLGYEVKFSVVDWDGRPAYAVDLARREFRHQHLVDKAICDSAIHDGLAVEMQRLARMMEHHSHFHGDKPIVGAA